MGRNASRSKSVEQTDARQPQFGRFGNITTHIAVLISPSVAVVGIAARAAVVTTRTPLLAIITRTAIVAIAVRAPVVVAQRLVDVTRAVFSLTRHAAPFHPLLVTPGLSPLGAI